MKKHIIFLKLVAGMLLILAPPLLCHAAFNQILYSAKYNGTPVFCTDTLGGVTYSTITYGNLINGSEPGMPSLPIDYLRFSVPYNATNFTVSTTQMMNQSYSLNHLLYPCQTPRMMNDTTPIVITLPDTSAYYSGATYPTQMAWVVNEGFLEGENHIVTVAVMPFQYVHSATSDIVTQKKHVNVRLRFDLSDTLAMYPIVRNDSLLREDGYRLTQSMVVNPSQVKSFAPKIYAGFDSLDMAQGGIGGNVLNDLNPSIPVPDTTEVNPNTSIGNMSYLIVTTSDLYNSVRRIAALKRQKGYNVKIVTMDNVMSNAIASLGDYCQQSNGTYHFAYSDSAGVLRQYLKWCYKILGTKYVFFIGNGVPYRQINVYHPCGEFVPDMPSDLYLSDLNGDWSTPLKIRSLDFDSELSVGRLLAKNEQQISNYSDKLLRYELNPGNGQHGYLAKIFYSEGLDMQKDGEVNNVHSLYSRIFSDSIHMKEMKTLQYPSGTDVISRLNDEPVGYISILNHAGPSGFITYGHREYYDDDTIHFYLWATDSLHTIFNNINYNKDTHINNGINNLTNKQFPNICYSIGCTTMPYDKALGYESVITNFGESFTTGKDFGGPAFLGNTRSGATNNLSSNLERGFVEQLINGNYHIGLAERLSKKNTAINYYYIPMVHNLLGDPEFEIWTSEPNAFDNITISRTDSTITITGIGDETATIALCDNEGNTRKVVASSNVTINKVSPNSSIMIYRHNYLPFIAPLHLQNVNINKSQYVLASDVYVGNNNSNQNVTIKSGVTYEIEASGTVVLNNGFIIEQGAMFGVYPSSF